MSSDRNRNWSSDRLLQNIVHIQNNVPHRTTRECPYTLLRLRNNVGYLKQIAQANNLPFDESRAEYVVENPKKLLEMAHRNLKEKADKMRLRSIQGCPEYIPFEPGQRVYVTQRGSSNKDKVWQRAATVIKSTGQKLYLIQWITHGNLKKDVPGSLSTYRHEYVTIVLFKSYSSHDLKRAL